MATVSMFALLLFDFVRLLKLFFQMSQYMDEALRKIRRKQYKGIYWGMVNRVVQGKAALDTISPDEPEPDSSDDEFADELAEAIAYVVWLYSIYMLRRKP